MSCPCLCLNLVISTWHLLSKHNEPMTKNALILGYSEEGRCKICSIQKLFFGGKTHFCLKGAVGSTDLKISKSALVSLIYHNFSNTKPIYTE